MKAPADRSWMLRLAFASALAITLHVAGASTVAAEAPAKLVASGDHPIRQALTERAGKTVTVRLEGGDELTGVVGEVGEHAVVIAQLAGREYFDALVRLDRITAVISRAK